MQYKVPNFFSASSIFFFCGLWRKKLAHMDKVWNIFRIFQKPNQNC